MAQLDNLHAVYPALFGHDPADGRTFARARKRGAPRIHDERVGAFVALEERAMRVAADGNIAEAAELLGISKSELIEIYDRMGIPYLCQSKEELDEEIAGFSRLRELRAV